MAKIVGAFRMVQIWLELIQAMRILENEKVSVCKFTNACLKLLLDGKISVKDVRETLKVLDEEQKAKAV
jgi:Ca2+-binding EF-hand superfamily protein